ncbi:paraquat-inducible protein B-like protein [Pseudomonas aeruginosa PA38182]|nr:paraquat-inducible protein B-like protein [Pseudomonas aeruginosa PA38182]
MSDLPSPKKHKTSNWSAIWVLPLVALAIGAWLAWRAFDQAGVDIQVRFESGDGIQANKTEVLYKGISVGKVTDLHVSKDIKGVVATIEIKKEAQEYLSKDTRFWLVKPRVSLAGVTGLETLVSGVYIAVDPVKGEKEERYFTAQRLKHILNCDFVGEETGCELSGHPFSWVVDPNDGTGDFLNRRPGSAISIGLLHNATPVLGVVYAPVTPSGPDCIAWAEGAPALLRNGRPVNNDLQSAILGKRPAKSPSELQH